MDRSDDYSNDSQQHWHFPQVQLQYNDKMNFSAESLISQSHHTGSEIRSGSLVEEEFQNSDSATAHDLIMQQQQQQHQSLLRLQSAQLQGIADAAHVATAVQNNDAQVATLNLLTEQLQQLAQAGYSLTIYDVSCHVRFITNSVHCRKTYHDIVILSHVVKIPYDQKFVNM